MRKKSNLLKNSFFILKERINETDDIITLKFSPIKGKIFSFIPGQFVDVYFLDDRCGGQGKPYSISSIPSDHFLNITVKKIGRFSGVLHNLKIGEKVKISFPQGHFYLEDEMKDVIFLAGGIGITPFYSIISAYFKQEINDRNFTLFYSNKTAKDAVFLKELNKLMKMWKRFKIINIFTREKKKNYFDKNKEFQSLNIKILKKYLKSLGNKHYFICGSIGFVNDLWKCLKNNKVKEENIRVESFY